MRALLAAAALVGLQGCIYYVYVPPKGEPECDRRDRECQENQSGLSGQDDDDDDDSFCADLRSRIGDCIEDSESREECSELEAVYVDYCLDGGDDDDEDDWDGDDDDDTDVDVTALQEGRWVMELTGPEKSEDCTDVILGGLDYIRLTGELVRLSEQEYLLETDYSQHMLFVEGETFFGEGIIEYEGTAVGSYMEGVVLSSAELHGYAAGATQGCEITAELWGTAE